MAASACRPHPAPGCPSSRPWDEGSPAGIRRRRGARVSSPAPPWSPADLPAAGRPPSASRAAPPAAGLCWLRRGSVRHNPVLPHASPALSDTSPALPHASSAAGAPVPRRQPEPAPPAAPPPARLPAAAGGAPRPAPRPGTARARR